MGKYCGSWKIDDIVYHKIQTSSVTTGAATNADAAPTWRVYEDATATPVTTGSYSTLNSMTGFYTASITLAAAIGYEKGKTYSIRYEATVASIIGADVDMFQIEAEVDANSAVTVNAILTAVSTGALSGVTIASVSGTVGSVAGAVTVGATSQAAIVDLVWDEPKSGHTTADTYGEYLDATVSGVSGGAGDTTVSATAAAAIATAVWDRTAAANNVAGSFGEVLNDSETLGAIVNAIWDEPKANHTTADTFGEFLDATVSGVSGGAGDTTVSATAAAAIADAVWDEAGAGHTNAGSFGARLNVSVNSMTSGAIGAVTVGATAASAIATATQALAMTVSATAAAAIAAGVDLTVSATAAAAIADAVWDEEKSGHTTADTYGEYLDSTTSAIKAETAAIKAKTDLIFAGTGNSVAVDVKFVNGTSVTGNGQSGTEWGPGS